MTREQQRKELCRLAGEGWRVADKMGLSTLIYWVDSEGNRMLSDPHEDLHCAHELEKTLTAEEWYKYDSLMPLRDPQKIHSSATHRIEAFLKVKGIAI